MQSPLGTGSFAAASGSGGVVRCKVLPPLKEEPLNRSVTLKRLASPK